MQRERRHRRFLAIAAIAALTPCCNWIGWNRQPEPTPPLAGHAQPPRPAPSPTPPVPTPAPAPPAPDPEPEPLTLDSKSIPTAKAVPGKDGFVFSPFNNHLIDVKGFKSGTLVSDPRFQLSDRKFFRVP